MSKKAFSFILASWIIVSAFCFWYFIDQAIFAKGFRNFWKLFFSLAFFIIASGLLVLLDRRKFFVGITIFISMLTGVFFIQNIFYLLIIIFSCFLVVLAHGNIQNDLESSIKISPLKSLQRGSFLLVIPLALLITSQYYFSVRSLDGVEIIPNINNDGIMVDIMNFVLPKVIPQFEQMQTENITIDDFLGEMYENMIKKKDGDSGQLFLEKNEYLITQSDFPINQSKYLTEIKINTINQWKEVISKNIGEKISGDEKIEDIFVAMVNSKMDDLSKSKFDNKKTKTLPLIFSVALFLTLLSVGTFVFRFYFLITAMFFVILRKIGVIKIILATKNVEVIA